MAAQAYYVSIPFISFQSRKRVRRQKTEVRRQKAEDKRLKKTEGLKVGGLEGWLNIREAKGSRIQGFKGSSGKRQRVRRFAEYRSQKTEDRKWKTEIRSCIFRLNPATHTGIIQPYVINHKREHNKYLQISTNYYELLQILSSLFRAGNENVSPEERDKPVVSIPFISFHSRERRNEWSGVACTERVSIPFIDLFFMVLDKIRYFSENTFGYNCIQEDIRT